MAVGVCVCIRKIDGNFPLPAEMLVSKRVIRDRCLRFILFKYMTLLLSMLLLLFLFHWTYLFIWWRCTVSCGVDMRKQDREQNKIQNIEILPAAAQWWHFSNVKNRESVAKRKKNLNLFSRVIREWQQKFDGTTFRQY